MTIWIDAHLSPAIASMILEELEDERRWDEAFASSPDLLAKLASEAIAEFRAGKTQELDSSIITYSCNA